MKSRFILLALLLSCGSVRVLADDDADQKAKQEAADLKAKQDEADRKAKLEEAIKARLADHAARKQAPIPVLDQPTAKADAVAKPAAPAPAAVKPKEEPITMMPTVEVRNARITELEKQLHDKDVEIAHERKNTKSSDLDNALNGAKVSSALSIFGGKSTEVNESLAYQRLRLLEAERDVLEALLLSKTEAERDELQKELEAFKAMRRDLDHAPDYSRRGPDEKR
jgi:hypothetical protein